MTTGEEQIATSSKIAPEVIAAVFGEGQIEASSKKRKGRGKAKKTLDLIEAMRRIAESCQPITGRGIGYKLFTRGLIRSMGTNEMQKVYRFLTQAREEDIIPWHWIVDETRELERVATWNSPAHFARDMARAYRRDPWNEQPHRVQIWSEKGTVRGVLAPVLRKYAVGFLPVHGFNSATSVHNTAVDNDGRDLNVLYVGDYDPSGLCMSERDLPNRLAKYDGDHVKLKRIALLPPQLVGLPSFPATDKIKDTRCNWFRANYGDQCWELDAMDPNALRDCVDAAIKELIDPDAWARSEVADRAERKSLNLVIREWALYSRSNEGCRR